MREDQATDDEDAAAGSVPPMAEDDSLRGEQPKESPVDERGRQRAAGTGAGGRPRAVGWDKARQQRRVGLPARPALQVALGPVAGLWVQLSGWQQDQVQAAAEVEIKRLEGLLEHPGGGPRLLADRLTDRLEETGDRMTVAREGCWPFFVPVVITSRLAMSRRLISWSRRWRAMDSMSLSVTPAPPMVLPRLRADLWPSRVRSRMYSRSIPDMAANTVKTTVPGRFGAGARGPGQFGPC
ncbi:hypothetical protein ACIPD2_14790 [Streptomyces griseofuscus]|uniref:hypothetical protein n=1 Tax=Streptomyces griseofuscus TaxID=146922 RepID=UPI00381815B6